MPKQIIIPDSFSANLVTATPNAQLAMWLAAKTCYFEKNVFDPAIFEKWPTESEAGEFVTKTILPVGHYGITEHASATFIIRANYATMAQIRTHRHLSCAFQSNRYTGKRFEDVAEGKTPVDKVFYLRPPGVYTARDGGRMEYTEELREEDLAMCYDTAVRYTRRVRQGFSREQARSVIAFDYLMNGAVTANWRTWMHFFSLRFPADAQLEIAAVCHLLYPHFQNWTPELMDWHERKLKGKSKLAP